MNYGRMLKQHNDAGSRRYVATLLMDPPSAVAFGVVEMDRDSRVTGFQEKPKQTDIRSPFDPDSVDAPWEFTSSTPTF